MTGAPVRRERMTRLRQTIARNMTESYTTIPQLTNFDDADITELEELRRESMEDYAASGVKLTTMPFLIKAIASSLKRHPVVNASIDVETNETVYKEYVNVGIAVDTPRGLIVPVMRDVDRLNIPQIAAELAAMAEMARDGSYTIGRSSRRDLHGEQSGGDRRNVQHADHQSARSGHPPGRSQPHDARIRGRSLAATADDAAVAHVRPSHRGRCRGRPVPQRRQSVPDGTRPTAAGAVIRYVVRVLANRHGCSSSTCGPQCPFTGFLPRPRRHKRSPRRRS